MKINAEHANVYGMGRHGLPGPSRGGASALVLALVVIFGVSAAHASPTLAQEAPRLTPTVITHSGEVTVSWQVLTHHRGLRLKLYAGDLGGFRLLAEGPAAIGDRTYTYIDRTKYLTPVAYQLRWVDDTGAEMTVATIFRVDARFSPADGPSWTVNRIDSGVRGSEFMWRDVFIERESEVSAGMADLYIPSPEVPPPRPLWTARFEARGPINHQSS